MGETEANENIRAVILWGTGKHFSTGADINWFKDLAVTGEAEKKRVADLGAGAVRRLFSLPISTIALVQMPVLAVVSATSPDAISPLLRKMPALPFPKCALA